MKRPPHGICIPVEYVATRDGDTVVVRLRTGQECAVRMLDCWAAERYTAEGKAASAHLRGALEHIHTDELALWLPLPDAGDDGQVDITDILKAVTFDRVVGRLFAGDCDLSEWMVQQGHATASKEKT